MIKNNVWLINLPHAGGSIITFKGWNKKVNCNVLNIEYPGHFTRMNEPLLHGFEELAKDVVLSIKNKVPINSILCLFGHSVGAIMAWYISPMLEEMGYYIERLFLSASQNPGDFPEKSILQSTSDNKIIKLVGYKTEEHSDEINRQFMETFFPILKNDMQVCKSFHNDGHYVNIDSIVLYGTEDVFTNIEAMKKWNQYVRLIEMKAYSGEHLFIQDHNNIDEITQMINQTIKNII